MSPGHILHMARNVRMEYPEAFYHVMARGNRREAIFLDDDDRRYFLQACGRTGKGKFSLLWRQSALGCALPIFFFLPFPFPSMIKAGLIFLGSPLRL